MYWQIKWQKKNHCKSKNNMSVKILSALERLLKISYTGNYILGRKNQFQKVFRNDPAEKCSRRRRTSRITHFCFAILFDVFLGILVTR